MKKFWGFYDNGTYKVGCNGAAVYVYDQNDTEIGRFQDVKYAYCGMFHPTRNVFVAKTSEGSLAVYDLDKMQLLHEIVITKIGAQDAGYAFSADGQLFYNIESPVDSLRTQLTIYSTEDFSVVKTLFAQEEKMVLNEIWPCENGEMRVMGGMRGENGAVAYGFYGRLEADSIVITEKMDSGLALVKTLEYRQKRSGTDKKRLKSMVSDQAAELLNMLLNK